MSPNSNIKHSFLRLFIFSCLLFSASFSVFAGEEAKTGESASNAESEVFQPTELIMHHIMDANEWAVTEHFVIPLPVIMYNRDKGSFYTGLSSAFGSEDGNSTVDVEGYKMVHSRVVPVDDSKYIDFSITKNVLTMMLTALVMLVVFLSIASMMKKNAGKAPKGIQNFFEPLIEFLRDQVFLPSLGKRAEKFMPYLLTVFFFIWINNMFGLIPMFPGGANVMGNISVTLVLAVCTLILVNINGNKDYWMHMLWMPGVPVPVKLIMLPIELIGVISKPFALMIRLFANITAGHIVVLSLVCLIFSFGQYNPVDKMVHSYMGAGVGAVVSVIFVLFISIIELLVAFLQAFVFTMLTSVFLGIAIEEHHHEEHHAAEAHH